MYFLITMKIFICDNHKSVRPAQTDTVFIALEGVLRLQIHHKRTVGGAGRAQG